MSKFLVAVTLLLGACLCSASTSAATSPEYSELPVFTSSHHLLDVLIIARAQRIQLGSLTPTAWVYTTCYRKDAIGDACPADNRTASQYGGMRLQLEPGDHLRMRFINQLPPAPPDAKHLGDPMGSMLAANPTNLHTHGLIVEPRRATRSNPTYGDYVYVLSYPAGSNIMQVPGLDVTDQPINYDIYVPRDHPSGSFWLHPHVHGLALNQMSYGLSALITIGSPSDYVTGPGEHDRNFDGSIPVRNMILKDMQVLPDSTVLSQEDPDFCDSDGVDEPDRDGDCEGHSYIDDGGVHSYIGGSWFFSLNGQVYPTLHANPKGEIWRLTQASGSRSYQVELRDSATQAPMIFQVLAVDGITLDPDGDPAAMAKATGGKVNPLPCPFSTHGGRRAVCTNQLRLMPSSRAEIWIPPSSTKAAADVITAAYPTGPAGDDWPTAHIAHVEFPASSYPRSSLSISSRPGRLTAASGLLNSDVHIDGGSEAGDLTLQSVPSVIAKMPGSQRAPLQEHLNALTASLGIPSAPCAALPPGHRRRIYFGVPEDADFGVGYEEVDQKGRPVPGPFQDIAPFDHNVITVCLPLAPGNRTRNEVWELVNVSGEDHNFHIHQTKFQVLTTGSGVAAPNALMDNVPLPHGSDACDGTVSSWRSGACQVSQVVVNIPFSEVGDFVYHCHILEHEDGGMMAHIRVVPFR